MLQDRLYKHEARLDMTEKKAAVGISPAIPLSTHDFLRSPEPQFAQS